MAGGLLEAIDPGDEVSGACAAAAQVPRDDLVGHGKERLMQALPAFHLRLGADAASPFVGAGRRIARTRRVAIFPTQRKDIGPTLEQAAEPVDLRRGWRPVGHRRIADSHGPGH